MGQKEALLQGKRYLEPVDLSDAGGPQEVMVRPLTEPEAGKVRLIQQEGLKAPLEPGARKATATVEDVDVGKLLEQQGRARIQAVAFGLSHSGEEWTVEEVGNLPAPQVRALANRIYHISGMRLSDEVKYAGVNVPQGQEESFRDSLGLDGASGGTGDGDAALVPGRDPAST